MMLVGSSIFILLAGLLHTSSAALPSYIKPCKRNDPKIEECIVNTVNGMRSALIKGIPEMDVPSLDPYIIDKIDVSRPESALHAVGSDLEVTGASNFEIVHLKADMDKLKFIFKVKIPYINIDGKYNVDMKLMSMVIKGNGALHSNNSDITFEAVLQGHTIPEGKSTKLTFDSLKLKIDWKDYDIRFDNLFNGNKAMGDAVNTAFNENKKAMIEIIRPIMERVLSEKFLGIANKITKSVTLEEALL